MKLLLRRANWQSLAGGGAGSGAERILIRTGCLSPCAPKPKAPPHSIPPLLSLVWGPVTRQLGGRLAWKNSLSCPPAFTCGRGLQTPQSHRPALWSAGAPISGENLSRHLSNSVSAFATSKCSFAPEVGHTGNAESLLSALCSLNDGLGNHRGHHVMSRVHQFSAECISHGRELSFCHHPVRWVSSFTPP